MNNLPQKTKLVLECIIDFQTQNGYSPSIPEIMFYVGLKSFRGVSIHLDKLQKLGFIHRNKNSRRSIKILVDFDPKSQSKKVKIPLVGEIHAGTPALAEENIDDYIEVPLSLLHGRTDAFLLKVKGESMLKAGFNPGDLVIVIAQSTAINGDIVVAFDPDESTATLKRFKKMQDYILLLPESDNPIYKPIVGKQFVIQGKVIDKLPSSYLS